MDLDSYNHGMQQIGKENAAGFDSIKALIDKNHANGGFDLQQLDSYNHGMQ